jgi:hypothetical protein
MVVIALTISGCENLLSPPQDRAKLLDVPGSGAKVVTYTGSLRGAYFLNKPAKSKYCAEPPPDVALNTLRTIAAKGKAEVTGKGSGEASFDSTVTSDAIELAGRTQMILLTRELLYRLCELSINHKAGTPEFNALQRMYNRVIDLIQIFAKISQTEAETKRIAAVQALRSQILSKIESIMNYVTASPSEIDKDKLKELLDKSPSAGNVRRALESAETPSQLRRLLLAAPGKTRDEMFAAIPK